MSHTAKTSLGQELAYPCLPPLDPSGTGSAGGYPYPEMGLRKRELFAAMAMQGLLANPEVWKELGRTEIAESAVNVADRLLHTLSRMNMNSKLTTEINNELASYNRHGASGRLASAHASAPL